MTREEVKQMLIDAGIEEPSKEAIDNFLAKHNAEVQKQKEETNKYKSLADENTNLKKQLEEIESKNLSDVEKVQKENEKNLSRIAELEKQMAISERKKGLAEKGIVGEQADKLIKEDGSLDIEVLGQILAERETKAKEAKEQELLDNTPNPDGGKEGNKDADDENFAKQVAVGLSIGNEKSSNDIFGQYLS